GLDPCFRLSQYAAGVIAEYLSTERVDMLVAYSGVRLRSKFRSRRWMRWLFNMIQRPGTMEWCFSMAQSGLVRPVASRVFFAQGSFPDLPVSDRQMQYETTPTH